MFSRHLLAVSLAAIGFVWLHAGTIPQTLEDEDSVNLALGVEDFNVARYAPHPPGYPVYIALAKATTGAVNQLRPDWPRDRRAAAGLSWLSVIAGALGIFAFAALWRGLGVSSGWSALAGIATAATPLYWFTAARPLTDTPGLVAAVAIQAALLHGLRRLPDSRRLPLPIVLGALAAGLAIGLRSQTMWMTMPLLVWVVVRLAQTRRWWQIGSVALVAAIGVLLWFVPLVQLTGGFEEYRRVVGGQGQHDFDAVRMLATHPSWTLLKEDLVQTFLTPWQLTGQPWVVVALGVCGAALMARRSRTGLALLGVIAGPYLVFHTLFHEVETIRYALPVAAMVAGLGVVALSQLGRSAGGTLVTVATGASLFVMYPVMTDYSSGAPVFRVLTEMRAARQAGHEVLRLKAHHRAWWATSRAFDWEGRVDPIEPPRLVNRDESQALIQYWRTGGVDPVWFLSDPDRSDLARFEPSATRHGATYRLTPEVAALMGGLRTYNVGWWRLSPPGWMLGRGWAITPEMASEAADPRHAVAFIRRHSGSTTLFVGTRHLDAARAPIRITARLDGREVDAWVVEPGDNVTHWISLPVGSLKGDDAYATLDLTLDPIEGPAPTAQQRWLLFDQFDASAGAWPLLALGRGWSPLEYEPSSPVKSWRLASSLSEVKIQHTGEPVRVVVKGDAPARDFQSPPTVVITAGQALLARFAPGETFETSFEVTPDVLDAAHGEVTIAVDLLTPAAGRGRGRPVRQPGLRITSVSIASRQH